MWNWTEQTHLIKDGRCVWLWSAACLSPIQRTLDPGLKADQPHQNHPFVINLSQSGKLLGGGKWGRSMFSRVGEWCLNRKINFFHFQKHYLFIIFKVFIFLGGVKLAGAPSSQLCPVSLWPVRAALPHWVRMAGRVKGPASRHIPGSCVLTLGMDRPGNLSLGIDTGDCGVCQCGVSWPGTPN